MGKLQLVSKTVMLSDVDKIITYMLDYKALSLLTSISSEKDNVSSLLFNERLKDCNNGL